MSETVVFFPASVDDPLRFQEACRRFDSINAEDPQREDYAGQTRPRELVYAERLFAWVTKLAPEASEALCLAARCQHLRRWKIPRNAYPMTRAGYLEWRSVLKKYHADQSSAVLRDVGYAEPMIERVRALNLKRNLATDPEMQILEDALCLVFLQFQFGELARKTEPEKTVNALRKSWAKMSRVGREEAKKLAYSPLQQQLLREALAEEHGAEGAER